MPTLEFLSTLSRHRAAIAVMLLAVPWTAGCAAHRRPATPTEQTPEQAQAKLALPVEQVLAGQAPVEQTPTEQAPAEPVPVEPAPADPAAAVSEPEAHEEHGKKSQPGLHDLCHQEPDSEAFIDETRRMLMETFCGATLWFDGLFGGGPNVENARATSGRVEVSSLYTEAEGLEMKGRLRLRYDLPNLERRLSLFLGRGDRDEVVEDRQEGFAIRSSVFGLETEDQWLAGLGYSLPGRWREKLDFRVGGKIKTEPTVFAQSRYRLNIFRGPTDVWRIRQTIFWENKEGFGTTASLDFDRVLRRNLLFHWNNVGTVSQSTDGMTWREAAFLYRNLRKSRALAVEIFARGETGAEVKMEEYGVRTIYRQPMGSPFFFGDLIVGYTWPRFEPEEPREGSAMLGLGFELLFGRDPY